MFDLWMIKKLLHCANRSRKKITYQKTLTSKQEKKTKAQKYLQVWQPKVTIQEFDATTWQDRQPVVSLVAYQANQSAS